jgi:phage tail P2-like protein
MSNIRTIPLIDLLPDSIAGDEQIAATAYALTPELNSAASRTNIPAIFARFNELSSVECDHQAWELGLKIWRDTWPIKIKRDVLKAAYAEMRTRGTRGAVDRAIESLGSSAVIREWFETTPKGAPHTFDITVTVADIPGQIGADTQADLFAKIDEVKPLRSHYTFTLATQATGGFGAACYVRPVVYARLTGTASNT